MFLWISSYVKWTGLPRYHFIEDDDGDSSLLALTRIKYCNKKAESLKTLINSVNKHQCNIVCNDVVKELVKRKVAVKLERVKLQHKIIAEKKYTAAGNESFTNDQVETIKKQYSGEKEENSSEVWNI